MLFASFIFLEPAPLGWSLLCDLAWVASWEFSISPWVFSCLNIFLMNAWYFGLEGPKQPNYSALCELCLRSHLCLKEKLAHILVGIDFVKLYLSDPWAIQQMGVCRGWLYNSQCFNVGVSKAGNGFWRQNWSFKCLGQATGRCTLLLVWKKE